MSQVVHAPEKRRPAEVPPVAHILKCNHTTNFMLFIVYQKEVKAAFSAAVSVNLVGEVIRLEVDQYKLSGQRMPKTIPVADFVKYFDSHAYGDSQKLVDCPEISELFKEFQSLVSIQDLDYIARPNEVRICGDGVIENIQAIANAPEDFNQLYEISIDLREELLKTIPDPNGYLRAVLEGNGGCQLAAVLDTAPR